LSAELGWLDSERWPATMSAAAELRLAYAADPVWRSAHPQALATPQTARALLHWLARPASGVAPALRAWCAARAADATPEAMATPGANVLGHFCYASGLRVSVEAMAQAMEAVGTPVARRNIRTDRNDEPKHWAFDGLETHDVSVIHTQPEPFFDRVYAMADLAPRIPATYRVAYWYWEMETAPAHWAAHAAQVDEIWAATGFVARALRQTVAVPVHALFPGVQIGAFTRRKRAAFGLAGGEGRFAFLFSFHMASIMERKNPLGLIRAFREAFQPHEPVDLILKTTSLGRHGLQLDELHAATNGANIQILDRVMTRDETLSLIEACDAYVSLHRSEGLGLTMAEAMLLAKPVIATGYSGNLDFMNQGNSLLVDHKLVTVGRSLPPYDAASHWAEPSAAHAARLMRLVYDNRAWAIELGAKAQLEARTSLSLEAAGARFAARLAAIKAAAAGPDSAATRRAAAGRVGR
jgi:glycosyltransferase involved in cell wall biosynthesis